MAEILPRLLGALRARLPEAVELRHRLHAHPELGNRERRTRRLLAEALGDQAGGWREAGCCFGSAGRPARPWPCARREMDGLPMAEATDALFVPVPRPLVDR
jgi:metal-dependent amidase/aminoacylase/carboxypeptidase family protein